MNESAFTTYSTFGLVFYQDKDNILSAEEKRNMLEDLQDKKEDIDNQQQQLEQQQYQQVKLQQQISKGNDFQMW